MTTSEQKLRRAEVLGRAALVLSSELSLPAVLQNIADMACEVADAQYGALGVLTPDGTLIEQFVTHGVTDEQRAAIGPLPTGHGILGALIHDARPLRLKRLRDDPRSFGFPPNHPPMTTFLGVPIAIRGRVFGNLYLTEKHGGGEFTPDDEEAVIKLAAHAAVAVDNARLYQEAEAAQRRLEAVNEVAQAILEGQERDEVLRLIARHARLLGGAHAALVATPGRFGEPDLELVDGDLPKGSSLKHLPAGARVLRVPLQGRDHDFGTLAVVNVEGDRAFSIEDSVVLHTFAAQASVALEHARVLDELQRLALAEDRERIAKELHDDVIQSLFAEGMALQASMSMLHDPHALEVRLTQAVENIDRVIRDLRNYIFGLRPGTAADRQLDRSLRDLAASFGATGRAQIEVITNASVVSKLAGRSADVIQLAREALSNAVRHSGGDHISLSLLDAGDTAILEIADSGTGFSPEQATGKGQGLGNLQARAAALGGELEIESEPGQGTWVRIRIPI